MAEHSVVYTPVGDEHPVIVVEHLDCPTPPSTPPPELEAIYYWDSKKLKGEVPSPTEGRLMRNGATYHVAATVNDKAVLFVEEKQGQAQTAVVVPLNRLRGFIN